MNDSIVATKDESGMRGTSMITEARKATKMKGENIGEQRVLESPRAVGNQELTVEMMQRLTNEIDKEMATPWNAEPSTQLTTPKKKQTREVQQARQSANFLSQSETE